MPTTNASAKLAYANSIDSTWTVNKRAAQQRRSRLDFRIQRRQHRQERQQRADEHAHRALVGGQLDVEIREAQQPDERGDRRRRADQRRVARLHRLHADEEGVRDDARGEQRRRGAPDARLAPCEVQRVGDRGSGVENEGEPR